jgi:hypothetical protein
MQWKIARAWRRAVRSRKRTCVASAPYSSNFGQRPHPNQSYGYHVA